MSYELQKFIFNRSMNRRQLLEYEPKEKKIYRIQVFRNHSFELVEHTISAYLDYARVGVEFLYSGYDDSFSFLELNDKADIVMIWIDATRYADISVQMFISDRIKELRKKITRPILVVPFGISISVTLPDVVIYNLDEIERELKEQFTDERAQAITGTKLSNKAMLLISKVLGLRYIPALLKPALKAIVVDFDNTLYQGVLGEDGINGVVLTEGHKKLQSLLKKLSMEGFFLCGASKNEKIDVENLLKSRTDFPLSIDDFTELQISWDSKVNAIKKLEDYLNINHDSMVFVDDNVGELTNVQMAFPEIKTILAEENAEVTYEVVSMFPGLMCMNVHHNGSMRKDDIKANEQRKRMSQELSQEEYIRSLKIHLTYNCNNTQQVERIAELANKTNQFIFNYKRYSQMDIIERMNSEKYYIVTVSLVDSLSDSGLVGVCVGKDEEEYIDIEECFISCRALGRGIDDVIVLEAINIICQHFRKNKILVSFERGARNMPADLFINKYLNNYVNIPSCFLYTAPEDLLKIDICEKED